MSSVQIDRLLDTVVKLRASDLHITVGRQPTIRLNGHLRNLQTKVLESDDMVSLMKSVTPERNQQELQEEGGTDFGFAYGDAARSNLKSCDQAETGMTKRAAADLSSVVVEGAQAKRRH